MRYPLLLALVALSGCAEPVSYERLNEVTGTLISPDGGICSATTVGRHVIATTKHCITPGQVEVRYQGINYRIERVVSDGREGLLVRLAGDLWPVAQRARRTQVGAKAWVVGNPAGLPQVLREARVSLLTRFRREPVILLDCRCWNGDSGAGVFDADGRMIAIFYGSVVPDKGFQYPMAYPLAFTREQWREAGL
jgi:V8-like Glu-specific endopeptidase